MAKSDDGTTSNRAIDTDPSTADSKVREARAVDFLPGRTLSSDDLHQALRQSDPAERAELISHLLCYAPWDEIWVYVKPEEVREIWDQLSLPDSLRLSWGRLLKAEQDG